MKIRGFIVTALLITMNISLCAQQYIPGLSLEEYLEYLVEIGFSEYETEDFMEEIASLEFRPVNINSRSEEELSRLFFLSTFQVRSIIKYINENGAIKSKYELSYIPGFDTVMARLCSKYISLDDPEIKSAGRSNTGISTALIYSDRDTTTYPGTSIKLSTRVSHQAGNLSLGLCFDKDRGERLIDDKYKPEFLAGHIRMSLPHNKGTLVFGDYRVRFGQGLAIWHGYSPGISPLNSNLIRGSSRIVPYLSSDENNFFRGLAYSGKRKNTGYIVYISANNIDANIEQISDSTFLVRSFYDSGIHNTPSGISKKDVLTEYSAGININHNFQLLNLGWSLTGTRFSHKIYPYELTESSFDFRGSSNVVTSLDYAIAYRNLYLYGETALSAAGKMAAIQGLRLIPVDRVKLNLLFGFNGKAYSSFHGHIFGKECVNNFRQSFLVNFEIDLAPGLVVKAGMIHHSELWYGYRTAEFPESTRYMAELLWKANEKITCKYVFKSREAHKDQKVDQGIDLSQKRTLNSSRIHLELRPYTTLKLTSRFEISSMPESGSPGFLAYQGIRYDLESIPLSLISRFYTYSIDNYDTRIYAWEDDLLFNPSVPSFYGKGSRTYLLIDYKPGKLISLRFKYGTSCFVNENTTISNNEYRLQLRLSLRGRKS